MMKSFTLAAILLVLVMACAQTEQGTLQKIRNQGEMKIAVSSGFVPLSFYNSHGELIGFDIDMSKEIAGRLGVKAVLFDVPWQRTIENLRSGACDAIVGSMAVTEARSALVDFSEPYYYSRSHLFVRKGSSIKKNFGYQGKNRGLYGSDDL